MVANEKKVIWVVAGEQSDEKRGVVVPHGTRV
jgi:hypothetical protein